MLDWTTFVYKQIAVLLILSLSTTGCLSRSNKKILNDASNNNFQPIEKINSLSDEKDFAASFSNIYVINPNPMENKTLTLSESDESSKDMSENKNKEIIGAVVGSALSVAVLVGGGIALKKFFSKSNYQGSGDDSARSDELPKDKHIPRGDEIPNGKGDVGELSGFDSFGRRVGRDHSSLSIPKEPNVPEKNSDSFVQVGRTYDGNFNEVVAALTKEKVNIGVINTLDDTKLPSKKRALVVMDSEQAQGMGLSAIGSVTRKNIPGTGDVQYQVIGKNGQSILMIAQRFDDIDSGVFPMNLAVVKGEPWKGSPSLGRGREGEVFDVDGFAVKIERSEGHNQKELAKVLKMQPLEGFVKVKGMYMTDSGVLAIMFEKLQRKDFSQMSDVEFRKVAQDLAGTVDQLKKLNLSHDDISPGNIMFRGDRPVLIDVGTVGSTNGYSNMGDDSIALARSLIDLRIGVKIREDFLKLYDEVDAIFKEIAFEIKKVDHNPDRDGNEIKSDLIVTIQQNTTRLFFT